MSVSHDDTCLEILYGISYSCFPINVWNCLWMVCFKIILYRRPSFLLDRIYKSWIYSLRRKKGHNSHKNQFKQKVCTPVNRLLSTRKNASLWNNSVLCFTYYLKTRGFVSKVELNSFFFNWGLSWFILFYAY